MTKQQACAGNSDSQHIETADNTRTKIRRLYTKAIMAGRRATCRRMGHLQYGCWDGTPPAVGTAAGLAQDSHHTRHSVPATHAVEAGHHTPCSDPETPDVVQVLRSGRSRTQPLDLDSVCDCRCPLGWPHRLAYPTGHWPKDRDRLGSSMAQVRGMGRSKHHRRSEGRMGHHDRVGLGSCAASVGQRMDRGARVRPM